MDRISLIAAFKALEILGKKKDLDGMMELVNAVLKEAITKEI